MKSVYFSHHVLQKFWRRCRTVQLKASQAGAFVETANEAMACDNVAVSGVGKLLDVIFVRWPGDFVCPTTKASHDAFEGIHRARDNSAVLNLSTHPSAVIRGLSLSNPVGGLQQLGEVIECGYIRITVAKGLLPNR